MMLRPRILVAASLAALLLAPGTAQAAASSPATAAPVAAAPAASPRPTATLDGFRLRVQEARTLIGESLPRIGERAVAGRVVSRLIVLLPAAEPIRVGGQVIVTDQSLLRAFIVKLDVTRSEQTRRELGASIAAYLASLESALEAANRSVPSDPDKLRELVSAQSPRTSSLLDTVASWIDKVIEWIRSLLSGSTLPPGGGLAIDIAWRVLLALLAALVGWIAVRAFARWRASTAARKVAAPDLAAVPVVAAEEELPQDALAHADSLAEQGRMREALRALFGGAARLLADAGILTRTRTRTNAELIYEVRDRPALVSPLGELSDAFETAWYGHVQPDASAFRQARGDYSRILDTVATSEGGGDRA